MNEAQRKNLSEKMKQAWARRKAAPQEQKLEDLTHDIWDYVGTLTCRTRRWCTNDGDKFISMDFFNVPAAIFDGIGISSDTSRGVTWKKIQVGNLEVTWQLARKEPQEAGA